MTLRRSNLVVGTLLALAASASFAAAQEAPACACAVPMTVGSTPLGSLTDVEGNVMVTQAAGYAAAQEGTGLQPGSRVILGADASATLRIGEACALDLIANSTATLLPTDGQLCVQLATPQTTARSSTLVSPQSTYGQSTVNDNDCRLLNDADDDSDCLPLLLFGTAAVGAGIGAALDDKGGGGGDLPVSQ